MALAPGTRLGPYTILGQIGVGGMGEVYRANDSNLGRDVAIKVLPDDFALDAERLARFEREARTLASLSHPNIATIHGVEKTTGAGALVMELVEGPTLADLVAQGPLPVEEALPIARQIGEALEAAHEQGVVHRDLKPANIKVRTDGTVKVLDFGLAKSLAPAGAMSPGRSLSPTITSPAMTLAGVILGTAAYMSPEQAKGRPADKRSDVWAFGCVLFEMLTGRRAFDGEDVSDTLAAILRSEPDWSALPRDLAPSVTALIRRSLEKDRRRRVGDIAAALFVLSEPLDAHRAGDANRANAIARHPMAVAAVALVGAIGIGVGSWWVGKRSVPAEQKAVTRFVVPLRADEQFQTNGRTFIALSPDGRRLAYVANARLNLRSLDRLESVTVRGTEGTVTDPGVRDPFFSPNGQWVGFSQRGSIKKVSIDGGAIVTIASAPGAYGFTWEDDGSIVFTQEDKILRVSESGGPPQELFGGLNARVQSLQMLPGRRAILFTLFPFGNLADSAIVVRSLDTGQQQTLVRGGIEARYLPTGHLVYFVNGALLAVPFDLRTLAVRGSPVPVVDDVATSGVPGRTVNVAHVAIAGSGAIAYVAGTFIESGPRTLVWIDRRGQEEPLGVPDRPYVYPRISPDGSRVAVTLNDPERDIWIWEIGRKALRRFTTDPANDRYSIWTPNGERLVFGSSRGNEAGTWWQAADGSGAPERLAGFPLTQFGNFAPTTISPDGAHLIVTATGVRTPNRGGSDLWMLNLSGNGQPVPFLETPGGERNAEIAPNGRVFAYEGVEFGQPEIYVRPFPDLNGGKWPVTSGGGSQPLWSPNGKELFYVDLSGALMSVRVERDFPPAFGPPAKVLDASFVSTLPTFAGRLYDISRDGNRFLVIKRSGPATPSGMSTSITVVQNWFEELKRLVPTP